MKKMNRNIFKPCMFICLGLMAVMLMSAVAAYDPPGQPGQPEIVNVGKDECSIKFTPPKDDGGSPICGYIIERRYAGGEWNNAFSEPKLVYEITIPNLVEGREVQFRVSAVSTLGGEGPPSKPSNMVLLK